MLDVRVKKKQGAFFLDAAFLTQEVGVTALFGHSGAGKTSIINMVAGLAKPDQGRIVVNGKCLFDSTKGIHLAPEKRRIGYVFQDGRLFPHLSVRSNLSYGMRLTPSAERYLQFDQVVSLLGIEPLLGRRPAKLSGGEKQRVAIGRALLTSPALLLMDEPLAALDEVRKAEVLPFIARLSAELSVPILYVSHALDEILNLADSMVLMEAGRVVAAGTIEELMSRSDLQRLTGHAEYGTVVSAAVASHDEEEGLTELRFAGGILKVPCFDVPLGARVRVRIQARNVAIALTRPEGISVQNMFPGVIRGITETNGSGSLLDVDLDIGCPMPARITPRACRELDLRLGMQVFALVKSVAVTSGKIDTRSTPARHIDP